MKNWTKLEVENQVKQILKRIVIHREEKYRNFEAIYLFYFFYENKQKYLILKTLNYNINIYILFAHIFAKFLHI